MTKSPPSLSFNTLKENFLINLLHKVIKEYKSLLDEIRQNKPLKILEISKISSVPGETEFLIHVTNKRTILKLTAAQIIEDKYMLSDFNHFHANMIKHAAEGKLFAFLKTPELVPSHKITSKKFDRGSKQYFFTIKISDTEYVTRTVNEIVNDKALFENLDINDIYNIAYTQGSESILKEKEALLKAKTHKKIATYKEKILC